MTQADLLDVETALESIAQRLSERRRPVLTPRSPTIVAIVGKVAVGKSYFTRRLTHRLAGTLEMPVINLPFEIWLDPEAGLSPACPYAEKFYLPRFAEDLADLSSGSPLFLMHADEGCSAKTWVSDDPSSYPRQFQHRNRTYSFYKGKLASNSTPLFVNRSTGILERRITPNREAIYIVDGTLVLAPPEVRPLYDTSVYLDAAWMLRVARMRGRFGRGETHDMWHASAEDYVDFLSTEAICGADREIERQKELAAYHVWNDGDPLGDLQRVLKAHQ